MANILTMNPPWVANSTTPFYDPDHTDGNRGAASDVWTATTDYDHGNPGILQFSTSRVTTAGASTVNIDIERVGGFSGAVGCTVTALSTTGDCAMTSGSNFDALAQVVTFSDQEAGVKRVTLTINSVPAAGLHYIIVTLGTATGSVRLRNPEMHVYVDDGGVNPSATLITAGSSIQTAVNAGSAGDLFYCRGGTYTDNTRTSGQAYGGYYLATNGTQTARVIVSAYPGETPIIDQNYAETSDSSGNRTTVGFLLAGDYMTISGFTIIETLFTAVYSDSAVIDTVVVEDCTIHDIANPADANAAYNGDLTRADNVGAIGLDGSTRCIMRYNTMYEIYDPRPGTGLTNPFTATPYSLHSAIHGFNLEEPWIHNNTISIVQKGVFQKNPYQTGTGFGHRVHDNHFSEIGDSAGDGGVCFASQVAGSGQQGAQDNYFYRNLCDLSDAGCVLTDSWQTVQIQSDTTTQSDNFWAYNNTTFDGRRAYSYADVTDCVLYSNVIDTTSESYSWNGASAGGVSVNNVEYCDFNCIANGVSVTTRRDDAGEAQYLTLAAWQGAYPTETQVERAVAASSFTTAPTYTNAAGGDYTTTTGSTIGTGRFGRDVGIGNITVGA